MLNAQTVVDAKRQIIVAAHLGSAARPGPHASLT